MIDGSRRVELKIFQSIEKSFDDITIEITIYLTTDRMEPMGSYIKGFNLKFASWIYEVLIRLEFIKILLGLIKPY